MFSYPLILIFFPVNFIIKLYKFKRIYILNIFREVVGKE